ncbi:hypothetical protein ACFOUP_18445 [Belliella kenyensis]|uniref:Uncharacterized protein n=1 Tax=Belliella kenyensis TaxID=1472724 RepID=A0ABV8EQQ5_9BACT|nr:hypothetical protein [Belliella kenyensis]MCH7402243.1 hypothetical protein [Belliella kenyensis]MDN3601757.1 hypothetical protein [Belliella kenyensis]
MNHKYLKPRQALNKAFLKVKPVRAQINQLVYELYGLTEEEIRVIEGGEG